MGNQTGWAKAGNFGIAALAVAIIVGIGLFLTGVIAPVEIPKSPGLETTAEPQPDTDTALEQSTDATTNQTASETGTPVDTTDQAVAGDVTEVAPEAIPTNEPEQPEIAGDATTLPAPPSIDVFRLETDGGMLVAGQTEPGWETVILVDGTAIATVTPDTSGQFVEFLNLEYSDQPRVLSLLMRAPDGQKKVASTDEIILTPSPKPVAVASADVTQSNGDTAGAESSSVRNPEADAQEDANAKETATDGSQAVLLADETGVQVLQPPKPSDASPEVMSTVALDAITYSDAGQVQLSGRALGSGSVRVYLNNAPVITSNIEKDGNWRSELPQVDTGVYTLRVDELDDQGRVTSRVETPFKREDEVVLAQAGAGQASSKVRAVTVQPGSTLWAISREAYGEGTLYVRVFEANKSRIRDPDLIYPGQVFTIPK